MSINFRTMLDRGNFLLILDCQTALCDESLVDTTRFDEGDDPRNALPSDLLAYALTRGWVVDIASDKALCHKCREHHNALLEQGKQYGLLASQYADLEDAIESREAQAFGHDTLLVQELRAALAQRTKELEDLQALTLRQEAETADLWLAACRDAAATGRAYTCVAGNPLPEPYADGPFDPSVLKYGDKVHIVGEFTVAGAGVDHDDEVCVEGLMLRDPEATMFIHASFLRPAARADEGAVTP